MAWQHRCWWISCSYVYRPVSSTMHFWKSDPTTAEEATPSVHPNTLLRHEGVRSEVQPLVSGTENSKDTQSWMAIACRRRLQKYALTKKTNTIAKHLTDYYQPQLVCSSTPGLQLTLPIQFHAQLTALRMFFSRYLVAGESHFTTVSIIVQC